MAYANTPSDQPDWANYSGATGDPLGSLTITAPGFYTLPSVLVNSAPTTLVNVFRTGGIINADIGADFQSLDGSSSYGFQIARMVTGASGIILFPNGLPILGISANVTAIPVGQSLIISSYLSSQVVDVPRTGVQGRVTGTSVSIAAGAGSTTVFPVLWAGHAHFSMATDSPVWSAVLAGTDFADDRFMVTGAFISSPGQHLDFYWPPVQSQLIIINGDTVARTFTWALGLG